VRAGTGPFLALQAARAGAQVEAVLGTRPGSVREAAEWLAERGLRVRPYTDYRELFEDVQPEVLIIASPLGTHRPWLQAGLDVGAHVYCEKPLITAPAETAHAMARAYAAAELVLAENCQWPHVLPAFRALHPDVDPAQATRFRMLLAPPERGLARWQESLSHPLSLLQEIAPGPAELSDVRFQEAGSDAPDARLHFTWKTLDRTLDCEVVLEDLDTWPRPAEFALDDALCRRRIRAEDYAMRVQSGEDPPRSVALPDPMEASLRAFLARVDVVRRGGTAPLDEALVRRQALLERLLEVYRRHARP